MDADDMNQVFALQHQVQGGDSRYRVMGAPSSVRIEIQIPTDLSELETVTPDNPIYPEW